MGKTEPLSLQLHRIGYAYGNTPILQEIDWTLQSGEITVLLGPNGAGKTTLLHLIAGMNQPQQGSITLNGQVLNWQDQQYKQRVGYMMEFPFQYPFLSVMEMMRLIGQLRNVPKHLLEERMQHWLKQFGLQAYSGYPMGALSQGTAKRVALASTLLHEPDILLLDEPTNGLDPDQVITVRDTLQAYCAKGALILLSTHIIGLAEKVAHQAAILRKGRIVYAGKAKEDLESLYVSHT
ncbi:ABC transporter ATPase [Paenibacillus dendritiformis]|uniref:ABC transporter ATP-binding protein n=1 Tax=Paenibacillus dendritiformis TaxID=130049 RepID=UPI0018CE619E|nr:ABC transporter ATP-binding protein [Paenibacillus dendritiformis]MBG9795453.1 ABC transporter ATPase [Paenibacillus dendritiformis]